LLALLQGRLLDAHQLNICATAKATQGAFADCASCKHVLLLLLLLPLPQRDIATSA
jgi:hypothetical protein